MVRKAVKSFVTQKYPPIRILPSIILKNFKFDLSNKKFSKAFLGIQ
jgi:hypothetical protein